MRKRRYVDCCLASPSRRAVSPIAHFIYQKVPRNDHLGVAQSPKQSRGASKKVTSARAESKHLFASYIYVGPNASVLSSQAVKSTYPRLFITWKGAGKTLVDGLDTASYRLHERRCLSSATRNSATAREARCQAVASVCSPWVVFPHRSPTVLLPSRGYAGSEAVSSRELTVHRSFKRGCGPRQQTSRSSLWVVGWTYDHETYFLDTTFVQSGLIPVCASVPPDSPPDVRAHRHSTNLRTSHLSLAREEADTQNGPTFIEK